MTLSRKIKTRRRWTQRPASVPTMSTRKAALDRAGYRCEVRIPGHCYERPVNLHHRRPRGMGGSRDATVATTANLLAVCGSGTTGCHGWIEQHRAVAHDNGWLLRHGADPAARVLRLWDGRLVRLTIDGGYDTVFHADGRPAA